MSTAESEISSKIANFADKNYSSDTTDIKKSRQYYSPTEPNTIQVEQSNAAPKFSFNDPVKKNNSYKNVND